MTDRDCFQCGEPWDSKCHFDCMKSLGESWEFMEESALMALDARKSFIQAERYFHEAKREVQHDMRKAYNT